MPHKEYVACSAVERDVLYHLRAEGELTGIELCELMDRTQAGISRALKELNHRNLIEREADGTHKRNSLSAKGRAVTTAAFDAYTEAL